MLIKKILHLDKNTGRLKTFYVNDKSCLLKVMYHNYMFPLVKKENVKSCCRRERGLKELKVHVTGQWGLGWDLRNSIPGTTSLQSSTDF